MRHDTQEEVRRDARDELDSHFQLRQGCPISGSHTQSCDSVRYKGKHGDPYWESRTRSSFIPDVSVDHFAGNCAILQRDLLLSADMHTSLMGVKLTSLSLGLSYWF